MMNEQREVTSCHGFIWAYCDSTSLEKLKIPTETLVRKPSLQDLWNTTDTFYAKDCTIQLQVSCRRSSTHSCIIKGYRGSYSIALSLTESSTVNIRWISSKAILDTVKVKLSFSTTWRQIRGSKTPLILNLGTREKCQLQIPGHFVLQETTLAPPEKKREWAKDPAWTFWRRENSPAPA